MTCKSDDGDLAAAAAAVDSHGCATVGRMGDADSEEDESLIGDQQEPFFQCMDDGEEDPSGLEHVADAEAELLFPGGDEDEEEAGDDCRHSFATAVGDRLSGEERADLGLDEEEEEEEEDEEEDVSRYDYGMWMEETEPMSIHERRRRLLHGMGLASSRDLLRSRKMRTLIPPDIPRCAPPWGRLSPAALAVSDDEDAPTAAQAVAETARCHRPNAAAVLTRCRSDSRLAARGGVGRRKMTLAFRRVNSLPHSLHCGSSPVHEALRTAAAGCPSSSAASKRDGNGDNGGGFENGTQTSVDDERKEEFITGYITPAVTPQHMWRSQSQPVPAAANKGKAKAVLKKRTRWLKNIKLVAGLINDKDKDKDGKSGRPSAAAASGPPPPTMMSKSASAHVAVASLAHGGAGGPERLKVHHYGKPSKELTGLYARQEFRAHEGSIWTMKFSADARLLATGGEDRVVRVWRVLDNAAGEVWYSASSLPLPAEAVAADGGRPGLAAQLSRKVRRGRSSKHVLPEHVVVPEHVFAIAEQPACAFEGHLDDVLDLSWSKSQQLLSSSMDKTVRLWDMDTKTCLKLFAHNDYVTCVQFNPVDDGYFISGSLDSKVRIWSVPERQVVDWSDLNDMVTAACYTPDGQAAIIGSHKGSCRFYKTTDCKLNQEAQIDMSISKKRKSQAKKITGFQFAPGNPSEILVTSADSQIRVFNGITVLQKFKGFRNTSSQISASYTADGRYVVCASEDSHVYLWRRGAAPGAAAVNIGGRAKTWLTSRSYEYFFCRDVSVALPWPGSLPPPLRPCAASRSASVHGGGDPSSRRSGGGGDMDTRRPKSGPMTYSSGNGPADLSSRREPSARWHGGAEGGSAWGLVVVTASRGGEIRVYQNFGLPVGVKGQGNPSLLVH